MSDSTFSILSLLQCLLIVFSSVFLTAFGCKSKPKPLPALPADGQKSKISEVQAPKKSTIKPVELPKPALEPPVKEEKKDEKPKSTKGKSQKQAKSAKKPVEGEGEEGDGYEACPEMTPEQLEKIAQESPAN